jgi:hypothetical protein
MSRVAKVGLGFASSLAFVLVWASATDSPFFSNNVTEYVRPDVPVLYNSSVRRGVEARKKGDLNAAIGAFSQASETALPERPNYELWAEIAYLYCKQGKRQEGLALLREYSCATEIMAGEQQCWINSEHSLDVPNEAVSPLCYAKVCNRAFEDLYWQGTTDSKLKAKYRRERSLAGQVRMACAKP